MTYELAGLMAGYGPARYGREKAIGGRLNGRSAAEAKCCGFLAPAVAFLKLTETAANSLQIR